MKKKIFTVIIAVIFIGALGFFIYPKIFSSKPEETNLPGNDMQRNTAVAAESEQEAYYTCPMHPSVHSDKPGACPVCGMALVKKTALKEPPMSETMMLRAVSLSPTQRVIANVATTRVARKSLHEEIVAVGKVDYAEPNYRRISTRFPGRLEKLYLSYTGQHVNNGDPVADIYSPEVISAQQEYLLAKESYDQVKDSPDLIAGGAAALVQQSREKLLLWGFTEQQIERLDSTKTVGNIVTMYSPISGTVLKKNVDPQQYVGMGEDIYHIADLSLVWVYAEVYEKDLQLVKAGQRVTMTTEAYPDEIFTGKVVFIDPVINPETRTVRIRSEFTNPGNRLKPEMYVKARIQIPAQQSLAVPNSAILRTGKRNIVWVEVHENTFEPREVTLGVSTDSYTQVLKGIREGESVVASGGYLIESESQLQQPSSESPDHQH
jgi:Cu(I)/Ag(I) efflux system membrane fusion protein